ncbi:glycoside hydrolase family 31 protein [Durotheca rogersii]|uniref:glycoside hydrolase family 31 protein n=1 Tax=Durotheca rogersii TaxID=419775 RepID=UPI002220FBB6|nr:glycoside hydrolase family 31 protein [Durotheca rogersii]KAI5859541.1 glycoside hydrolase family 31 protein [Durotheca rogersii]
METVKSIIGRGLLPSDGDGPFLAAEYFTEPSWIVASARSSSSWAAAWYLQLGSSSRILLFTSVVCSLSLTVAWRRGALNRSTMIRAVIMIFLTLLLVFLSEENALVTAEDESDVGQPVIPNVIDPEAVNPQSVCPGYTASNVRTTNNGLTADLTLAGDACNVYGTDIEALSLTVEYQAADRLHVEILPRYVGPENYTWFILPEELIPKPHAEGDDDYASRSDLEFSWNNEPTFSFKITRKSSQDVLFSTEGSELVYEDQFIEFGSSLPESYNLYGLGEVIHGFRLGNNLTRTLFAADVGDIIDANIYGNHPIYLDTRYFEVDQDTGALKYAPNATDKSVQYKSYTHGVFQRNAHAQEVLLRESNITWRALGGDIDLYFYQGPSQDKVTKSYQKSAIGLPAMQQYWTFGYHQCRWGYANWSHLQDVINNFARNEIPLETIWSDIDYMKSYRDFENDPINFPYSEGADFISQLHKNNQHYVPIIDSAIYAPDLDNEDDAYPSFNRGLKNDAFLLNPDGSVYIGMVWPGYTVFPDWIGSLFNGTGANEWWISEVAEYFNKIRFDGIWIDMSEVASFCVGSCGSDNRHIDPVHPRLPSRDDKKTTETIPAKASASAKDSYLRTTPTPGIRNVNWPPYTINNFHGDMAVHAVSPNATHHGGILEYDVHNLYGHQILNATYHALLNIFPTKRPFIIGRSQFAGSGKWAGHWGGDNYSLWAYMFFTIPQALSFSLFGIPMFGPDTCGFSNDADAELCSRWTQLSAFFPFYRNHNVIGAASQEPYVWPEVAEAARTAMKIRYALLPYIYTTFYLSHSTGSTTMRALAWEFPNEPWLADADRQFLLGDAILVTPCLVQGATTVDGVFPGVGSGTVWYDWYNQTAITGVAAGQNVTIGAPLGHIPVYIRGGSVIPLQEPGLTTAAVRASPWSLLIALDGNGHARGGLYIDDGESLTPNSTTWVDFLVEDSLLKASPRGDFVDTNALSNVTIMGADSSISRVTLNGKEIDASAWDLKKADGALRITGLNALTAGGAWSREWTLSWS